MTRQKEDKIIGGFKMTKHTPTPWELTTTCFQVKSDPMFFRQGILSNGIRVAEASGIGAEGAHDNAAFIVQAVNSFEAFVKACKALEQFEITPDKDVVTISYKAIELARKALTLAGEA